MFILTQPTQTSAAGSSDFPGKTFNGSVANGTTGVLDTVDKTTKTLKWIVEVTDSINKRINSYEILATNRFDTDLRFSRHFVNRNAYINHVVDVVFNGGGDIELIINNNDSVDIDYVIARIQLI